MAILKPLRIGDKIARIPIIQGGMGVGVSLGSLAGAVAKEGAVGIISTAQMGFYRDDFEADPSSANLKAIHEQVKKARDIASGNGLIGVNIMVALKDYALHVTEAAKAGVDIIISGAGLPMNLPGLVKDYDVKLAPIVSSFRAARLIFNKWKRTYNRIPDMVVIEGPKAGGHLGFSLEELTLYEENLQISKAYSEKYITDKETISNTEDVRNTTDKKNNVDNAILTDKFNTADIESTHLPKANYDDEIIKIIEFVNEEAETAGKEIPVVVAGGIFDKGDIEHAMELGASGVQMASRFVCTDECDASEVYKTAYMNAKAEDLKIIKSPVGMPGRAIRNRFTEITENGRYPVKKCRGCLAKCKPAEIPYCITDALIRAVKGDVEDGLVFCGANAGRIDKKVSVHELIQELI